MARLVGDVYTNVRDNMAADEVDAWLAFAHAEAKMADSRARAAERKR